MIYRAATQWTSYFSGAEGVAYPSEYVIRIYRGNYPRLAMPKPVAGQRILDVGCGDGRNMLFFQTLGLDVHGVEISNPVVEKLRDNLGPTGIPATNIQLGSCAQLPYDNSHFDYLVAWNSSYYMSLDGVSYHDHVAEFQRVLKPGGWIVLSVPKLSSFIFDGSDPSDLPGCRVIRRDPFGVRNGETLRAFRDRDELEHQYSGSFDTFCHADVHDDCFGYAYHWHLMVARRK